MPTPCAADLMTDKLTAMQTVSAFLDKASHYRRLASVLTDNQARRVAEELAYELEKRARELQKQTTQEDIAVE